MAGVFVNTNQKVMLDSLSGTMKSLLNNPYYLFSDKKGSVTQYYNTNTTKSTLDEATRGNYSELGPNSPIRYNKIKDTILYGLTKIDVDLEVADFGLEASEISGEAYVLPNTFTPYPGDFFTVDHISKPYLFKVTNVTPNMLDTGSTMYKINYVLAYPDLHDIEYQVVAEYVMATKSDGTNVSAMIESSVYDNIMEISEYVTKLKDYYYMLFYSQKVQTFVYLRNGCIHTYDPYLIEFLIRNDILKGATDYVYIAQQMFLPSTFGVDYDKTIFASIEDKDVVNKAVIRYIGNMYVCKQNMSLLYAYPEDYYYMKYENLCTTLHSINIFGDLDILYYIRNNIKTNNIMTNIMIKYFNDEEITKNDLVSLKNIDYHNNADLYYGIPITIFCLEKMISNMVG